MRLFANQWIISPFSVLLLKGTVLFGRTQALDCSQLLRAAQAAASCRGTGEGIERGDQARHLLVKRHLCFQESLFYFIPSFILALSLWKAKIVGEGLASLPACSTSSDPTVVPLLPVRLGKIRQWIYVMGFVHLLHTSYVLQQQPCQWQDSYALITPEKRFIGHWADAGTVRFLCTGKDYLATATYALWSTGTLRKLY